MCQDVVKKEVTFLRLGSGDIAQFRDCLTDTKEIRFGCVNLEGRLALVTFMSGETSPLKRARATVQAQPIKLLLKVRKEWRERRLIN